MKILPIFLLSLLPIFANLSGYKSPQPLQKVYIQHLGKVNPQTTTLVVDVITNFYGFDVIVDGNLKYQDSFKVKGMNRLQANRVLTTSNIVNKPLNGKVLILTEHDICTDRTLNGKVYKNWGIFGLAGLGKKSTIVSTYRMKSNYKNRLSKVIIHELGHTLGLPHCNADKNCLMNDVKGVGNNLDKTKLILCDKCKKIISIIPHGKSDT
jgi:archaemetzincin